MALPRDLQGLGLGGLLSGGITNQLGQQSAQFQDRYRAHRDMQMEQIRSAFAMDTRLIERGRDPAGAMRYELETQIARHKREVEKHLRDAMIYGTSGHLTVNPKAETMYISDEGIMPLSEHLEMNRSIRDILQAETDKWLRPVKL